MEERKNKYRESPGKHGEKTRGDFLRNYQTQYSIVFAIPDLIKIRNTPPDINSISGGQTRLFNDDNPVLF